jgi:hypothetical protein
MIPDIAMPAVRRLVDRGGPGRERSNGQLYERLINGDRGGFLGYAMWRRYLKLAQGYTAAHPEGIVRYTAHELRHVCASRRPSCSAGHRLAHRSSSHRVGRLRSRRRNLLAERRPRGRATGSCWPTARSSP